MDLVPRAIWRRLLHPVCRRKWGAQVAMRPSLHSLRDPCFDKALEMQIYLHSSQLIKCPSPPPSNQRTMNCNRFVSEARSMMRSSRDSYSPSTSLSSSLPFPRMLSRSISPTVCRAPWEWFRPHLSTLGPQLTKLTLISEERPPPRSGSCNFRSENRLHRSNR
jgi:hypothetical protein